MKNHLINFSISTLIFLVINTLYFIEIGVCKDEQLLMLYDIFGFECVAPTV